MNEGSFDKGQDPVIISIQKNQDGESHFEEHRGSIKKVGDGYYVVFSEIHEKDYVVTHLLNIRNDGMDWMRKVNGVKSRMTFAAGESSPFLFETPYGALQLKLITHSYSHKGEDKHTILIAYSVVQGDAVISDYETRITIYR